MSIYDLQRSKRLREFGHGLGREGLAKLVLEVAKQICESKNYVEVICGAGRIAAIAQACNYDGYWAEKVELGKQNAEWLLNQALKRMQKIAAQDNAEGDLQQTHNSSIAQAEKAPASAS